MKSYNKSELRGAAMEYLFTKVSPLLQEEAIRQVQSIFRSSIAPENLITVHIRWGDKGFEMELIQIEEYINAVKSIVEERLIPVVSIYLATSDPQALIEFAEAAPSTWKIYKDILFHEYDLNSLMQYNQDENGHLNMHYDTGGKSGFVALASILVAMEANYFVLTTASNWSRLINELRINVVNPRCANCTRMIDLLYDEW